MSWTARNLVIQAFDAYVGTPPEGTEQRILRRIPYDSPERGRARRLLPLAAAAAALLAVAAMVAAPHLQAGVSPAGHGSQAPVFYYEDAATGRYVAVDWTGRPTGSRPVIAWARSVPLASPDGSRFLSDGQVYDGLGRNLGKVPVPAGGQVIWADDSTHLCLLSASADSLQVMVGAPDDPLHVVAGVISPNLGSARLLDCGLTRRVVAIEASTGLGQDQLWVLDPQTDAVRWQRTIPAGHRLTPAAGGRYLIESGADGSLVLEAANGTTAGRSDARLVALADKGTLAVAVNLDSPYPSLFAGIPGSLEQVRVVDWSTGRVVWQAPHGNPLGTVLSEPRGERLLVGLLEGGTPHEDLFVISPDGSAKLVASAVHPGPAQSVDAFESQPGAG